MNDRVKRFSLVIVQRTMLTDVLDLESRVNLLKRKPSTLKLKISLRPGAKLSEQFSNSRDCYKVVETDNVLSYVVSSGGTRGVASICPLYSAFIHIKVGVTWHVVSSHERGDRLNDYTYQADYQGCTLAAIAAQAIAALEERRAVQQVVKQVVAKKRRSA
jgi:hypothetical protein